LNQKKIIAVVGSTGAQGGGLARAILDDPTGSFALRALTRDPKSDKARALAARGAEVVAADVDDPASLEHAFAGAHGIFCVTFFWNHFSPEKETAQGRTLAAAAERSGAAHVVWSTLEDTRQWMPLDDPRMPTLQGRYKVPHFDSKGEADADFQRLGARATILRTSFYWENFIHFGQGPKPGPDGVLVLGMPLGEGRLPGIASEDIGRCTLGIFRRGVEFGGKTVGIAGEMPTGAEMASGFSRAFGREVRYRDVPPEVYRAFGFPGAEDMGNMYQFKRDFNHDYCANRSVELSRRLNPALQSFSAWAEANRDRIPIA
jgi:uncharacterized protein YbjT (DUF2867 family)